MLTILIISTVICSTQSLLFGLIGTEQSAGARGNLTCNGEPAAYVRVKLFEKEATLNVKMAETTTDAEGNFVIEGWKTEVTTIDPRVSIYHKCGYDGFLSDTCYKKLSLTIPDEFVSEGRKPEKIFDVGTINLAGKFSGEGIDCFN